MTINDVEWPTPVPRPCHHGEMEIARGSGEGPETFSIGWLKAPGRSRDIVGAVSLPDRPSTLGEARHGLQMVASDAETVRWLGAWAAAEGEERSLLLRLPGGWYELRSATIARVPGAGERFVVRFDRRSPDQGPAAL
jgi:hypothetical protein